MIFTSVKRGGREIRVLIPSSAHIRRLPGPTQAVYCTVCLPPAWSRRGSRLSRASLSNSASNGISQACFPADIGCLRFSYSLHLHSITRNSSCCASTSKLETSNISKTPPLMKEKRFFFIHFLFHHSSFDLYFYFNILPAQREMIDAPSRRLRQLKVAFTYGLLDRNLLLNGVGATAPVQNTFTPPIRLSVFRLCETVQPS